MSNNKNIFSRIKSLPFKVETVYQKALYPSTNSLDSKDPKVLTGRLFSKLNCQANEYKKLEDVEFQVFSQWGDDGIIQYLVNKIDIQHKTFIEFGVENYKESNTRFLLINNNWSGLVIDGSESNIQQIKDDPISWGYELHSVASFITAENINQLISDYLALGYDKEIGILSVDIDGNDYWVWKAIDVINPAIVIVEYNSLLGSDKAITTPYDPSFVRNTKHNILYYGVSVNALNHLAASKGYTFIGCNSSGNNAYFIRNDKMNSSVKAVSVSDGYVRSKFRELVTDDKNTRPIYKERTKFLDGLPFYNVQSGQIENFKI